MPDKNTTPAADQFRPSDYSAAIVQRLLSDSSRVVDARVLDVGCGSGVLLATAGAVGAAQLTGVDIEAGAVQATKALLEREGHGDISDIHLGEIFAPLANRQFDLVLANLPHFPMDQAAVDGRLASWSTGGADGRGLLDRFLCDLSKHLAPGGRALVMHNAFVGLDLTLQKADKLGLSVEVVDSFLVPLPKAKLAVMTREILTRETGTSIHRFGEYGFGTVAVLSISAPSRIGDSG